VEFPIARDLWNTFDTTGFCVKGRGRTDAVEKPLFLRRWGMPFEAIASVFGRDPMYSSG
jgi:hypothetical protein